MKPVQSRISSKLQTRPGSQTPRAYSQQYVAWGALAATPIDPTYQETISTPGLNSLELLQQGQACEGCLHLSPLTQRPTPKSASKQQRKTEGQGKEGRGHHREVRKPQLHNHR